MPSSDQGINLDRYLLVPRTLIFLVKGDHVLLLKGGPEKRLWSGLYNGLGGHVERGEDVFSAAYRELVEETGFEVDDLWLCGLITIDTGEQIGVGTPVISAIINLVSLLMKRDYLGEAKRTMATLGLSRFTAKELEEVLS